MATYNGWENAIELRWEYPLGTVKTGTDSLPFNWLSESPDSLSVGAMPSTRRVFGYRYLDDSHLRLLQAAPAGALGPQPLWFTESGTAHRLNRLLSSHFQNAVVGCSIPDPVDCYAVHFPQPTQPGTWGGFRIFQHYGDGTEAYRWVSGVMDKMTIGWVPGQPVTITPEFKFLEVNPAYPVGTEVTPWTSEFNYMYGICAAPLIKVKWNGTVIEVAGFRVISENNITTRYSTSSRTPVGFLMGEYIATLELDVWMSDDFYSLFVGDYLGTGVVPVDKKGTCIIGMLGPTSTGGTVTETYNINIQMIGKIIDIPSISPKGRSGIQTIKMQMTGEGTGFDSPFYIKVGCHPIDYT
jgi:hypothetical protein